MSIGTIGAQAQAEINASVAAQLRAAADFVEKTPGLKVTPFAEAIIHYFADTMQEVDEQAAVIGTEARWDGHHYSAKERFGTEAVYSAVHICKGSCRRPGGHAAAADGTEGNEAA
jgi:hypothetical protein